MKRSAQVVTPLLAAAALGVITGCHQPEMQRCVDEQNHVVADSFCKAPGQDQQRPVGGGGIGYIPIYRYYYGGAGGWGIGSMATGGGYAPITGRSYSTTTKRFGFGSSFGGGEGGGGE